MSWYSIRAGDGTESEPGGRNESDDESDRGLYEYHEALRDEHAACVPAFRRWVTCLPLVNLRWLEHMS